MKTNIKALELIEFGISSKTVSKLTESQIEVLHSKLLPEAITQSTTTSFNIPTADAEKGVTLPAPSAGKTKYTIQKTPTGIKATPTEQTDIDDMSMDSAAAEFMEADDDLNNPWAICTKSVGRKNKAKYERCVLKVKKGLKEGKNPVSLFVETKIMDLVEKHIPAKMTKGELLSFVLEDSPAVAPSKPKTSPTTKPGKPDVKPRPSHPGKNPNPGTNPAPKAGKKSHEDAKKEIIDLIVNILEK